MLLAFQLPLQLSKAKKEKKKKAQKEKKGIKRRIPFSWCIVGINNSRDGDRPVMSRVTSQNVTNVETSKFHQFIMVLLHSFCTMDIENNISVI